MHDRAGMITEEGAWLEIHRSYEKDRTAPMFYVTDCGECLDLNDTLESSAMTSGLWPQRGKVLLAFGRAHHGSAFTGLREWVFLHELKMSGWPAEYLREIAELAFDAGLERAGERREIIVREQRLEWETYAERQRRRHGE